ncbi:helix-turn-helix transcriptional regulator [Rhodobacterales bacterium]|nr:helix-turn-helix transcriptional regulator [Rhodobacterales bacterium]
MALLFVPLPFVNALLLALLFAILRRNEKSHARRLFLLLIAVCCLQSVLVGVRWGYGISELRFALPLLAACLPPITYECFRGLVDEERPGLFRQAAAPAWAGMILFLLLVWPIALDATLILLFTGYAAALLTLARSGADGLEEARLEEADAAFRAILLAAACLGLSAAVDLFILLDFEWSRGSNAALIVSSGNVVSLFLIGIAAAIAGRARTENVIRQPEADQNADTAATEEDTEIVGRLDDLMKAQQLFRDENLNLARLARRAGLPARRVSQAINRVRGRNVSRYVNDFRIAAACQELSAGDLSVTEAMYRSGFVTKSNFNKEFLRVTGKTPDTWRKTETSSAARTM